MLRKLLIAFSFAILASPTHAGWLRAESTHFIVYSQGDEASLRSAATRLEKFDTLQRLITGAGQMEQAKQRHSLKVRVYFLPTDRDVQAMIGGGDVSGYYHAAVRGPFAVMSRENNSDIGFPAQLVLFHELTHHFMMQYFPATYPTWYSEGFADFLGASTIDDTNQAKIGRPVNNRFYSLNGDRAAQWIPMRRLVISKRYSEFSGRLDMLYAEGWLLTHYLNFAKNRVGQLQVYLSEVNAGKPYDVAASDAFGDLDELNHELHVYARANKLPIGIISIPPSEIGPVTVTAVPAAQSALMLADIRIGTGIMASEADRFARSVAKVAAAFPDDAFALRIRAEADRLAGDRIDEADAVARWAKVAPHDALMMMHRGQIAIDELVAGKSRDPSAWQQAHKSVLDAHIADPQNPEILKAYYDGFVAEGVLPPDGAHNALYLALSLVPQDEEARFALAADFERRGLISDAITTIRPSAYAAEDDTAKSAREKAREKREEARFRYAGEPDHESAREMLLRLEAGLGNPAPTSSN